MNYWDLVDMEWYADNPNVRWKPHIREWIAYNMRHPIHIEQEVTEKMKLNITFVFTDEADAALFKMFWL